MNGVPRLALGIDSFSYHRYFGEHTRWEPPLSVRWTTADFLACAARHGVALVSMQTCYLPPVSAFEPEALRPLLGSMTPILAWGHPDGLQGGTSAERAAEMLAWLPKARALGCTLMRLVGGNHVYFQRDPAERTAQLAPIIREIADEAARHGLALALENHADFVMRDLLRLIERVGAPNLGVCLDTGNAARVGDDPLAAATLAAPLVKMVHLKDMRVQAESRGDPTAWWPSTPLGRGDFDLPAIVEALEVGGYRGGLLVELSNLYPDWDDEDAVVAESLAYLRRLLSST
jgi:sugar phosphate isomerase/epimerase